MSKFKPKYVTMDYAANPTLLLEDNKILIKGAEQILYSEYYKNSPDGWPRDPETGQKLPIKPMEQIPMISKRTDWVAAVVTILTLISLIMVVWLIA